MSEHARKAVVISSFWATIFAGIIGTGSLAIVTAAWSYNEKFAIMQTRVSTLEATAAAGVNMPSRLSVIETQLTAAANDRLAMQQSQRRLEDKLDLILQRGPRGGR